MDKIITLPWQIGKKESLEVPLLKKQRVGILKHSQNYTNYIKYIYIKWLLVMLKMKIKL